MSAASKVQTKLGERDENPVHIPKLRKLINKMGGFFLFTRKSSRNDGSYDGGVGAGVDPGKSPEKEPILRHRKDHARHGEHGTQEAGGEMEMCVRIQRVGQTGASAPWPALGKLSLPLISPSEAGPPENWRKWDRNLLWFPTRNLHAAQDGYEYSPTQNHKFT